MTAQSRGPSGFARAGLFLAWLAFWLNTALFPCCEVTAAVLGSHSSNVAQPAGAAPQVDHSETSHSGRPDHDSDAPCGSNLTSVPVVVGESEIPAPDRSHSEKFILIDPLAFNLADVFRPANAELIRATPPPPPRFYERTQRLLI